MYRRFQRAVLILSVTAVLAVAVVAASAAPALAYGKANWQITFSATGVAPGTGFGIGFWGWCDFAGGVTSGNSGDCAESQYVHLTAGSGFTCQVSLDFTAWHVDPVTSDFIVTGTANAHPAGLTTPCLAFFPGLPPGTTSFTDLDYGIEAVPGHRNLGAIFGTPIDHFSVTVTQIP
jgi:hypothetical protein